MNPPAETWGFIGTILAAVLAGTASFLVTVLSKEQKTSEFRQAWIDALRQDLAEFAGIVASQNDVIQTRLKRGEDLNSIEGTFLASELANLKQVEITRLRILFRVNPQEHKPLIARLEAAYQHSARDEQTNPGTGYTLIADFVTESQKVLKAEWSRVKRGEPAFRVTKWASLIVLIVALICALVYVSQHLKIFRTSKCRHIVDSYAASVWPVPS
jgi:hypothetical protein